MLKYFNLSINQALRTAYAGYFSSPNSVMLLVGGTMPDLDSDTLLLEDFTPLTGANLEAKPITMGVLHHHDGDNDAFHITPVEWNGDNTVTDQAAVGFIIHNASDPEPTTPILYAEQFADPILLMNALTAFTLAPIIKIPRRGNQFTTSIIE